ncbi:Rieske 2Fe-2S domain-containing protein [Sandaracinus amylolyticus]|uniref:Rieske 2Fe-2S domain-containing protein n=1 Tax=Sandaracinus amylolyticus TaxID=927083 RepID=UPI001F0A4B22|nr:Rieske 2Fe-2S domain-containing protein [Sandaracinus amylolyticus]
MDETHDVGTKERDAFAFLRTKGRASVVRLADQWFIACAASELKDAPRAETIQDVPLVLFRDERGRAAALLDRCPHRNVPLSGGKVVASEGTIECPYHGWRFDREGACRAIPSFCGEPGAKARTAPAFPVIEQDGWIWVYSTPFAHPGAPMPSKQPHRFALASEPGYTTVHQTVEAEGTMYSAIENALDVPHTAFLHRGLFRSESRGVTLTVKVRRSKDRVEAEYVGEPRPPGLVARILSPSGGIVTHFDRFILPSIAQVEYRIGTENHFLADTVCTPVSDFRTKLHAVVSFRSRVPGHVIAPFVKPLALRVFQQDAVVLKQQTETIKKFGGEQFASTEIDVLGKHIWRLLRAAERGDASPPEEEAELQLVV